jgi:hypothetical protein
VREFSLSGLTNGTTQSITAKPHACSCVIIPPGSAKRVGSKRQSP